MYNFYVFWALLFFCLTSISAQETSVDTVIKKYPVHIPINIKTYDVAPEKFPMHINSTYPWGIYGLQSKNHIYNFSLSLVAGMVRGINGLQVSGVYSQAPGFVNGLQIAGGGNSAGNLKGVQISGVTNYSVKMRGIQITGFANASSVDAKGIQMSGFINAAADIKGIQIGAVASAAGSMTGIQIGGISNIAQNITGVQISATYNRIDTLKGVAIGIASFADTIAKGISLSLVNIVKYGAYKEWELSFSNYANVAISYRMGTQKFYTVYTTGVKFIEDNLWTTGVGFGNRTPIGNRFGFQPELVYLIYFPTDFKKVQYSETHLKLGFVYRINEKFSLSLAPSVYMKNNKAGFGISIGIKK
jgi:hypothetical protein